ncbi:MAG: hypothetical protein KKF67_02980 [Nanoarchaeota archaeon]|nr:hypothetical protein [Nanoarchaeota archaeon]
MPENSQSVKENTEGKNQKDFQSSASKILSEREQRIRKATHLYYSRKDIQKAIFEFSKNREVVPRYFEGFGKRPDSLQYPSDIFELVKKGATSFHCSEELWSDPLKIETGMNEKQMNELRIGWDLIIDIDSKYIDYSKICAEIIINMLRFHGVKNVGVKFSGSKGFHLIIPWKAFPEKINDIKTSDMFPEYPRIITKYIQEKIKDQLIEKISDLERPNKYVKDFKVSEKVMPDLILVSPRHLFRMPYSLHEKTALVSVVIESEKISEFELKDAHTMKVEIKNFTPDSKRGEAGELLMQALDWYREHHLPEETRKQTDFEPVKITNLSDKNFPPCLKKILSGITDGRKRAVFVLINFFRSLGIDKNEIEKRIYEWNERNEVPLKKGYIKSQLSWSFRKKPVLPPNCKEYYQGIAVCIPDDLCRRIKNPVNYTMRKSFAGYKKNKDNFKNNN